MTPAPSTAPTGVGGTARAADRPTAKASLLDAVADLRRDVEATRFPLALDGVEAARGRRRQLLDQLDDHLLPRLRELSAPAMVVVAGSTGAGKSTIVNSLLGEEVSAAGVLRPTTRRPVLVHHPDDAELLAEHPLLAIVDVVARPGVPRGIAVIDAPDLDSLLATNRSTAHRLLEAADLWVFVTTAARYGDALPWEVLDRATARGTSMAMVLNRAPAEALIEVRTDLLGRLRGKGMSAVPLFLVPDAGPHEGLLEARAVAPILRWLTMVAGPDRARSVIARTQRGSLAALRPWVDELAEVVQAQVDARIALAADVERAVAGPAERARAAVLAGAVADGPVRTRWTALSGRSGALGGGWSGRRGQTERVAALATVAEELGQASRVALSAARRAGELAVRRALDESDAPGAAGLRGAVEQAGAAGATTPDASSAAWLAAAEQHVEELAAGRGAAAEDRALARQAARLVRAAGTAGAGTVVAAAAVGLGSARVLLEQALGGPGAQALAATVAQDLAHRAHEQAAAGAQPVRATLASDHLADDAASRLRLRLAVLKGLT